MNRNEVPVTLGAKRQIFGYRNGVPVPKAIRELSLLLRKSGPFGSSQTFGPDLLLRNPRRGLRKSKYFWIREK